MPRKDRTDRKRHHFQCSLIDAAHLFVMIANATCVMRALTAQDITAVYEGDRGIAALQHFDHIGHMADEGFTVALALKETDTQRVMGTEQMRLVHRVTTFERRLERITASAIFTASGIKNGTTHSSSDSPRCILVTTMNQTVPTA